MRAAIICIIGLVLEVSVWAEPHLEGRVRLESGEPVVGAQVLLFDLTDLGRAPVSATTDRSGHFTLPLVSLAAACPNASSWGPTTPTRSIPPR